mmetsp:Transcript_13781/g.20886  ORF Transcript_13781/g.20886 Transcript_13781/m.20886 type:complete len:362 (-) Transcript_13781:38-1123(-)
MNWTVIIYFLLLIFQIQGFYYNTQKQQPNDIESIKLNWKTTKLDLKYSQSYLKRLYKRCGMTKGKIYCYGGRTGISSYSSQFYSYFVGGKPMVVTNKFKNKTNIPPLSHHSMTLYDEKKGLFLIYGGKIDRLTYSNNIYVWDVYKRTVELIQSTNNPSSRADHTVEVDRDRLVVFGGTHAAPIVDKYTYFFNLTTKRWTSRKNPSFIPATLYGHASCKLPTASMLISGGLIGHLSSKDVTNREMYVFDFLSETWTIINQISRPRSYHSMILFREQYMLFYGGFDPSYQLVEGIDVLDIKTMNWLEVKGWKPPSRHGGVVVHNQDRDQIMIIGGSNTPQFPNKDNNEVYVLMDISLLIHDDL